MSAPPPPTFVHDWFSQHIPSWTRVLAGLAGRPDLRVLEIGSQEGRSARWLLENVLTGPGASIDCVDTFTGSAENTTMNLEYAGIRERFEANVLSAWPERVRLHVGPSARMVRALTGPYDLVYVDGSHAAADVIADAVLAWPLVVPGGLVIFDDYAWDWFARPELNPRIAVEAFLACHAGWFELVERGYQMIVRKRATYDADLAARFVPSNPVGR